MKIFTTLLDSHLYVFSKWVLDLLSDDKEKKKNRFSSLKGDFVPYLISCQGSALKQASNYYYLFIFYIISLFILLLFIF